MLSWLTLLLLLLATLLLGWLWLRPVANRLNVAPVGLLLLCLLVGMVGWGWPLFVLAENGRFSLLSVGVVWGVLVIGGIIFNKQTLGSAAWKPRRQANTEHIFLALWLVAAAWLFLRSHQFIVGGADAGVYLNLAASLAENGRFTINDPFLASLPAEQYPALLRALDDPNAPFLYAPGFYIEGRVLGQITPQFYHLHSLWLAVPFAVGKALGGTETAVQAALLLVGAWGILAGLAVYQLLRQMAGWRVAALGLMGLSLCAMQVWFARYPTTEMMTQFWLWLGLWCVVMWLEGSSPRWLWALLAGMALGQVFLIRIDMFLMLPIFVLLCCWLWLSKRWDKTAVFFFAPFTLFFAHSLLHGYWQSRPYFLTVFGIGVRLLQQYWLAVLLGGVAGLLLLWLAASRRDWLVAQLLRWERPLRFFGIGLLLGWAIFNWFVRPELGEVAFWFDGFSQSDLPIFDHQNLRRLGWYLSPVGVWLGVVGAAFWLWRLNLKTAVPFAVGLFFLLLYVNNIRNSPHQIYAMRRFVPAALPFLTVATAWLLGWLAQREPAWQKGVAILLMVAWLAGLGWNARGFVTQVDYAGLPEQLAVVNESLEPNAVLLFANLPQADFFGTPLRFLHGHDLLALRTAEAITDEALVDLLQLWHNNGRSVYWIGDVARLEQLGLTAVVQQHELTSSTMEVSYEHKPQATLPLRWQLQIAKIEFTNE